MGRSRTDWQREYRKTHPAEVAAAKRKQSVKRKDLLATLKSGPCTMCGGIFPACAMDFHHRDPTTKDATTVLLRMSMKRLMEEIAKCDLLCANCHRILHLGPQ